jgi:hypothetical protein
MTTSTALIPTSPPNSGAWFGGTATHPTSSPPVVGNPYYPPNILAGTVSAPPVVPNVQSVTALNTTPANVLAPQFASTTSQPVNPYTSGIGPGTATSAVFGSNPTLYHPGTRASQTNTVLPANSPANGPITATQGAVGSPIALGGLSGAPMGGSNTLAGASNVTGSLSIQMLVAGALVLILLVLL